MDARSFRVCECRVPANTKAGRVHQQAILKDIYIAPCFLRGSQQSQLRRQDHARTTTAHDPTFSLSPEPRRQGRYAPLRGGLRPTLTPQPKHSPHASILPTVTPFLTETCPSINQPRLHLPSSRRIAHCGSSGSATKELLWNGKR